MGNQESSIVNKPEQTMGTVSSGERGQNVRKEVVEVHEAEVEEVDLADTETDSDSDEEEKHEGGEGNEDEELIERLRILEDSRQLKQLAIAFLHPERPVEVDSTFCARCYFDRASAPQRETFEESEERHAALQDAAALKRLAIDYMHPEISVKKFDSAACSRCYFDRASAPQQESMEEAEERAMILDDAKNLRRAAFDYMHPELGVVTSDPTANARCYFDRASAPQQESMEEAEEHRMVLADAAALKRLVIDYMHPELGVVTSDPTANARCYFDRPSASLTKKVEAVVPKKAFKTVSLPVSKDTGIKTIDAHLESSIRKSASEVHLYGLDKNEDSAFF